MVGRDQLGLWARGLELFTAARARHDPARFFDVDYDRLVADPAGTAEACYRYFGLPLSGAAADAMRAASTPGAAGAGRPEHHYRLAEFGLTGAEVDALIPDRRPV